MYFNRVIQYFTEHELELCEHAKLLLVEIETLRSTLEKFAAIKGYCHPEVVALSQELDILLNQYQKLFL